MLLRRTISLKFSKATLALAIALIAFAISPAALAQTFTVLYNFTGGTDGGNPQSALTLDISGNIYGTTVNGGDPACLGYNGSCGVVFKLDTTGHESVLHSFENGGDGLNPSSGVVFDSAGNLYGATEYGGVGTSSGAGVVYKLDPSGHETILHVFNDTIGAFAGGINPIGELVIDGDGYVYGATRKGGDPHCATLGCGLIYRITPAGVENVLHAFAGGASDGEFPIAGPIFGPDDDLYFTSSYGANHGSGAVFRLGRRPGRGHGLIVLELASGSGQLSYPGGGIFDSHGRLYLPAQKGGNGGGDNNAGGIIRFAQRGTAVRSVSCDATNCYEPNTGLVLDAAGNLYGTSQVDGTGSGGTVFKLDTAGNLTGIYDFSISAPVNGYYPMAGLVRDSAGNLYGTTSAGGANGWGVIFKITP